MAAIAVLIALPAAAIAAPMSLATTYDTHMVIAFDPQVVASPPTGVTTTQRHYRMARLRINGIPGITPGHRVRIDVFGSGLMCSTEPVRSVHARLGLRVTIFPFTFADVVADCPSENVPAAGNLAGAWQPLTSCLPPAWAGLDSANANIELLSTQIIDDLTGLPAMSPGFRTPQNACPVPATAQPEGRLSASSGNTYLVQAMDPCTSGTVVGLLPPTCFASNSFTDGTPFTAGRLVAKRNRVKWQLKSSSIGSPLAGKTVRLLMGFRATDPAAFGQLTHPNQTVLCPAVVVPASGNIVALHDLYVDCGLTPTTPTENMEAIDAAIIDVGTGLRIAVVGLRQP